jgi:5-methylcytosine-specific restriction endonuclease McrA
MSGTVEAGPEQTLTADEDDPHIIFERCGCRCQVCGTIGHPHGLEDVVLITYPLHPDYPADVGIVVCNDCLVRYSDEQLDEYVAEEQERQRALEEDPGDYKQNRERAFERDDHTCQLCGQEGYPKTERGLVAYPVRAGDYHLDNLVTVCNDCITDTLDSDEDGQKAADRLRLQAARAKEWVNSDDERPEQGENIDGHR